jgi:hypothetical protein
MTTPGQPNPHDPAQPSAPADGFYGPASTAFSGSSDVPPSQQPPNYSSPQPWPAGSTGGPAGGDDARRRRRLRIGLVVAGVVALLAIGFGLAATFGAFGDRGPSNPTVDRTSANAVASAFLSRYVAHDPSVCDLVSAQLHQQFEADGRCAGSPTGPAGAVTVIMPAIVCGDRAGYGAAVTPAGQLGAPYASVGLELDGSTWAVRSLLPLSDRSVIQPYRCATSNSYGG